MVKLFFFKASRSPILKKQKQNKKFIYISQSEINSNLTLL